MLLPRSQITRSKLCFYYTCKCGVISIKYVITGYTDCPRVVVRTSGKDIARAVPGPNGSLSILILDPISETIVFIALKTRI
jgi:hypothetical protein